MIEGEESPTLSQSINIVAVIEISPFSPLLSSPQRMNNNQLFSAAKDDEASATTDKGTTNKTRHLSIHHLQNKHEAIWRSVKFVIDFLSFASTSFPPLSLSPWCLPVLPSTLLFVEMIYEKIHLEHTKIYKKFR